MDIFGLWNVHRKVRKKDFLFLARVRVSSQYFPILDCISHSCARKRSWLSLWLGLAVDILQFWNVNRTVRKKASCFSLGLGLAVGISSVGLYIIQLRMNEDVALAVVRVSSGYFPALECISYSTQEGLRVSR